MKLAHNRVICLDLEFYMGYAKFCIWFDPFTCVLLISSIPASSYHWLFRKDRCNIYYVLCRLALRLYIRGMLEQMWS